MRKFLKHWNWKEISLLVIGLIIIIIAFICGAEKNWLAFITSLLSVISTMFIAKGFVYAPAIDIIPSVLYCIICFQEKFYGEVVVYIGLIVPMGIATIIKWFTHRDKRNKELVRINKISKKELMIILGLSIISLFVVYLMLKVLNTNQIIFNTLTLVLVSIAGYLTFRRCSYYSLPYILYDVVCLVMWVCTLSTMGTTYIPTIISCVIMLLGDFYGFIGGKFVKNDKIEEIERKRLRIITS